MLDRDAEHPDRRPGPAESIPAGRLSLFAAGFRDHLRAGTDREVPCGTCRACCRSSQFVDIDPDETSALAHIPGELLAPAPGRPPGHMVLAHDRNGCCPMLTDAGCGIYEHRPRACRSYDCRVFAAAEVRPAQPLIAARATRWRFEVDDDMDRDTRRALVAAVDYLTDHFPASPPLSRAAAAVAVQDAFSDPDAVEHLDPVQVAALIRRRMSGG